MSLPNRIECLNSVAARYTTLQTPSFHPPGNPVTALTFAALIKCFFHLHQLFGDYSHGKIFTRNSVRQLRQLGIACLLWGFMDILWGFSLAISTHPRMSLQGHSDSLVIGPTLIIIAWFMGMAVDLREENELTI